MNVELMKKLRRRFLRMRHKRHFDMKTVAEKTECGTAMCIAGHTLDIVGYTRKYVGEGSGDAGDYDWFTPSGRRVRDAMDAARRLLGLSYEDTQHNADEIHRYKRNGLFLRFDIKTPKQAASLIQKLIETEK